MKLLDLFGKITEAVQQLRLSMAESMTSVIHQLRLQLLANAVQLLVPLAPVSDITASLVAPFRKVATGAGLRCCSCCQHSKLLDHSPGVHSRACLAAAH